MSEDGTREPKKFDPEKLSKSIKKMETFEFPSKKSREEALKNVTGKETIPAKIKKELTEEARRRHNLMAMEGQGEKTELPKVKPFVEKKPASGPETTKPTVIQSGDESPVQKIERIEKGWLKKDVPSSAAERVGKSIAEEEAKEARKKAGRKKKFGAPPDAEMPPSMDETKKFNPRRQAEIAAKPPSVARRPEQPLPEPKRPGFFARLFGRKK